MTTYVQLRNPNPNINGTEGLCLVYGREVFGIPAKYETATEACAAAQFKHNDQNFPNVAVPVWFTDHVEIYVPGQGFYGSPYNTPTGHVLCATIADVERHYGVKFVCWSEDIDGVRVAQSVADPTPAVAPTTAPANPGGQYTVHIAVPGFTTAANAASHQDQAATVQPGTYFVFNQADGMINATTQQGVPGSWINPTDNQEPAPALTAPAPAPAVPAGPQIGDHVTTTSPVDQNGNHLNLAIINDGQSVWSETNSRGDAVLTMNGVVRCAVSVTSLVKA